MSNGNPIGVYRGKNSKRSHWAADSREFPSLEAQRTAGNTKRSAGPSTTEMDRATDGPTDAGPPKVGQGDAAG